MKNKETVKTLQEQFSRLSGILLENLSAKDAESNIVFSPYSVFTLLALAADASVGRTREEITDVLVNGTDFDRVLETLTDIRNQLIAGRAFTTANAVIVREDKKASINPDYPAHLRRTFDGELFAAGDMVAAVNRWVQRKSKGMIPEIADETMREMLLCLLNACSFIAKWEKEYEYRDIRNLDFHNRDGSVSRVKVLNSLEKTYIEDEHFIGFARPYKGGQFSYVVLLPKEGVTLTEELLSSIDYSALLKGKENTEALVLMPEFQITSDVDLTGLCRELGIRTIFTPEADLTPVSSEWLRAEGILHKAHIEVDREGTKAAAVSMMYMIAGCAPSELPEIIDVDVDRPFLYAIVHHESGLPVFVGAVNHLEPFDGDDNLTDEEKEALCKPVYDRICKMILDEDGLVLVELDYRIYDMVAEAYESHDLKTLKELEMELGKL